MHVRKPPRAQRDRIPSREQQTGEPVLVEPDQQRSGGLALASRTTTTGVTAHPQGQAVACTSSGGGLLQLSREAALGKLGVRGSPRSSATLPVIPPAKAWPGGVPKQDHAVV